MKQDIQMIKHPDELNYLKDVSATIVHMHPVGNSGQVTHHQPTCPMTPARHQVQSKVSDLLQDSLAASPNARSALELSNLTLGPLLNRHYRSLRHPL